MSDLVTPGEVDAVIDNRSAGAAWEKSGMPWIVDGVDIGDNYGSLDTTGLNGFRHATTSGLDVTIEGGEAYVAGWLARDVTTTITLPGSTTTRIYVGYDADAILGSNTAPADSQNVIVGPDGDFAADDPRVPIYDFTTDATTVTSTTDLRQLQKPLDFDPVNDAVDAHVSTFRVAGSAMATEAYVDNNRYTDSEARSAVTAANLPGTEVNLPSADGYPDGFRVGASLEGAYSFLNGETTIYNTATGGAIRFRNHTGPGDVFRVGAEGGGGWILGGLEAVDGLLDASGSTGLVPRVLGSTESLPSDTVTGRMIYDPSREQ